MRNFWEFVIDFLPNHILFQLYRPREASRLEAKTHEAEAKTHEAEAEAEAEATTHEAKAEAEARFFGLEAEARPRGLTSLLYGLVAKRCRHKVLIRRWKSNEIEITSCDGRHALWWKMPKNVSSLLSYRIVSEAFYLCKGLCMQAVVSSAFPINLTRHIIVRTRDVIKIMNEMHAILKLGAIVLKRTY